MMINLLEKIDTVNRCQLLGLAILLRITPNFFIEGASTVTEMKSSWLDIMKDVYYTLLVPETETTWTFALNRRCIQVDKNKINLIATRN